ncbi:MAG: cytochrome c [Myxococcota bacterium]
MLRWLLVLLLVPVANADDSKKRPTDEQRGKELYDRHCVACHGAEAKGDGPATASLVFPVPDLAGQVKTDKAAVDLVVYGRGPMPAYEASFDAEDARRVLKYMATAHQAEPTPPPQATVTDAPPAPDAQQPEDGDVGRPAE